MDLHKLAQELQRDEGFRPHAYRDTLGYLTIGIGRLIDKDKGGGITNEEAMYLLENDIGRCVQQARANIPFFDDLSDARQRALVNMIFQLGLTGLLQFKKMLRAMEIGNFERAALEASDSRWFKQTPERAKRVVKLIKEG